MTWQRTLFAYLLAALGVLAATGLTLLLEMLVPEAPNTFFMFAVIVAVAWLLGTGPGWLSVVLSTLAVDYFFIPPLRVLDFGSKDVPWLLAFAACAAATNAFSLRRRAIEEMSAAARDELEGRVRERTASLQTANDRLAAEMVERSRAEAALREARNELLRASRIAAAAELTASIAHEINQPLAAVVSNSEAALNWLNRAPPVIAKAQTSISATVEAGERAAEVIKRVRGLITRGYSELKEVEVNGLIRGVMLLASAELTRRDILTECHYQRSLPPILGDHVQLQQLVLNLVNNAAEAMNGVDGQVRLISIRTCRSGAQHVQIIVEDRGPGLADTDIGRLFEPFYSTKDHGMGMGLSICRSIAESHGGTIRAAPGSETGARFEVELPIKAST